MERQGVMVRSGPPPAREWLAQTQRAFVAFWSDDVARLVKPAAQQLVHRYFDLLDQRERAMRRLRAEPETTGSTGQKVLNPSGTFLLNIESALTRMESALGVDPAS